MSSRPILKPFKIFDGVSLGGNATSDVTIIQSFAYVGFTIAWTGTPAGTFAVQVSNDYSIDPSGEVKDAGTWTALTLSSTPTAAGSSGNDYVDIQGISSYAIRLVYTRTSGTGTVNATICGKAV